MELIIGLKKMIDDNLEFKVVDLNLNLDSDSDSDAVRKYMISPQYLSIKRITLNDTPVYFIDEFTFLSYHKMGDKEHQITVRCDSVYKETFDKFKGLLKDHLSPGSSLSPSIETNHIVFTSTRPPAIFNSERQQIDIDNLKYKPEFKCKILYQFELKYGELCADILQLKADLELPPLYDIIFADDDDLDDEGIDV